MPANKPSKKQAFLQFSISMVTGAVLLFLLSFVQQGPPPHQGAYYVSSFFRNELSWLAMVLFAGFGFAASFFMQWNPWLTGIGLIGVLPLSAIIEGTIYRGTHNLLPFELMYYGFFAIPGLAAALAGRYFAGRRQKQPI